MNMNMIFQRVIERCLNLCGQVCRMKDDRMMKSFVFGIMEEQTGEEDPRERECVTG